MQVKRQMYTLTTSFLSFWMYNGYILYLLMSSGSFFCRACRRLFKRFFATVKFVGRFLLDVPPWESYIVSACVLIEYDGILKVFLGISCVVFI